jgi:hypothetical protein
MPKTLADLRAAKTTSRPERAYTACLAQHLVAEVGSLTDELASVEARSRRSDDDEDDAGPKKRLAGPPRVEEIKARLAEILDEMAEHEGELRIRAVEDGEWRRWTNEHPARDEDEPGHQRDQTVAYGYCNADDLIDDLATYAHSWNGEELTGDDWSLISDRLSPADKKQIASLVVSMHESDVSIPKWRSALSANLANGRDSSSRNDSESPTADSTAGSRLSDTSTSAPTET